MIKSKNMSPKQNDPSNLQFAGFKMVLADCIMMKGFLQKILRMYFLSKALPGNPGSWFLVCDPILTHLDEIWKTTSIFLKMEDDLNFFEN